MSCCWCCRKQRRNERLQPPPGHIAVQANMRAVVHGAWALLLAQRGLRRRLVAHCHTEHVALAVRMLSIASHVKAPRAHAFEACRRGWMRVEQRREHTLR